MIKRDLIVAVLLTFSLTVMLFQVLTISSQGPGDYDPWYDINDDGKIDMKDIGGVCRKFGASGTAINKTELLLDLQARVAALEAQLPILSISAQETYMVEGTSNIPGMSVTINCAKQSHLVILFSAIVYSYGDIPWCRAWIDGTFPAYPGDVELCSYDDLGPHGPRGFNFFTFVPAGTRTITMQWWIEGDYAYIFQRTLTVIAIPIF